MYICRALAVFSLEHSARPQHNQSQASASSEQNAAAPMTLAEAAAAVLCAAAVIWLGAVAAVVDAPRVDVAVVLGAAAWRRCLLRDRLAEARSRHLVTS